jgi:replicative DNA helicase
MEGKRPQLSDLRDSGAIEQDADKVLFIHRPEYYRLTEDEMGNSLVGVAEIIVAKNRNGAVGVATLRFDAEYVRFCNLNDRSVVSVAKSHCNFAGKDEFSFTPNRYMEVSQNKELETNEPLNKLIDELDLEKPPF